MIDWKNVETVLLDMDGTLLDLHFDNYFWMEYVPRKYCEKHGLLLDDFLPKLHQRFESEKGTMQWYCLDYWSSELDLDIVALKREVQHKIDLRPSAEDFLKQLKLMDKHVILLTNAHRGSLDLKMEITAIDHYFDALVSTHDYGMPKEDIRLWDALKDDYHYEPANTALVDDTESVLASAEEYGIRYLLTIRQPDSRRPAAKKPNYPAIDDFATVFIHE